MRLHTQIILALLVLAGVPKHGAAAGTVDFPQRGFSISAMDAAPSETGGSQLMMFLPATDGFAPNINVMIQPYPNSIQDYIALSKGQFTEMKLAVLKERVVADQEWVVEYKGAMQRSELHFYVRAISKAGRVYLVTATAKESQWASVAGTLRQHVDSFRLK